MVNWIIEHATIVVVVVIAFPGSFVIPIAAVGAVRAWRSRRRSMEDAT